MELHRKLTYIGAVLLVATFLINYYHETDHLGIGFNYAYATGIAMVLCFGASFVLFTKDKING